MELCLNEFMEEIKGCTLIMTADDDCLRVKMVLDSNPKLSKVIRLHKTALESSVMPFMNIIIDEVADFKTIQEDIIE